MPDFLFIGCISIELFFQQRFLASDSLDDDGRIEEEAEERNTDENQTEGQGQEEEAQEGTQKGRGIIIGTLIVVATILTSVYGILKFKNKRNE